MFRKNKGRILLTTAVTLVPILVGLALWGVLPERVPTHWNAAGEMDGWSSKAFAVFAIPGIIAGLHLFCVAATCLDPRGRDQTGKVVGLVLWICPVISLLCAALTYTAALGVELRVWMVVPAVLGVLFIALGNYLPKCRRNYTIGIKVPWALDSEENWNATHRFAGKVWVVGGILVMFSALLPVKAGSWVILASALLMGALPVGYSYLYYRKCK